MTGLPGPWRGRGSADRMRRGRLWCERRKQGRFLTEGTENMRRATEEDVYCASREAHFWPSQWFSVVLSDLCVKPFLTRLRR